jgi:type I restriction enzyme S subunit
MSSEFQKATLGKLVNFSNGRSSPDRFEDGEFAVFGSNGLIGRANETNAPSNSIVIGRVGSYCGSVHFSQKSCWVTDNAIKAEAKDKNNPEFLFYLLKHLNLNNWRSGSGQPLINQTTLNAIEVRVPEPEEQKEIGQFIGSLDDRISLLRETNTTLESIAQALFKSWFVDFDPVRAKQQGNTPQGMDAATAALFPDSFEESELGEVPKGWRVLPVGDAVEAVGGATPDTKNPVYWESGTFCWTTPKDLSGIAAPVLLDTERKLSAQGIAKIGSGLLPIGTLLLSSRAPIGYLALAQVPLAINQGYIAMLPGGLLPPLYMLFWCQQNMEVIKGRANGSTFMEISKKAFRPIPALLPPSEVVQQFMEAASALFEKLIENEKQARTLATLRDNLLPRLISGQLRLPKSESHTVEASI